MRRFASIDRRLRSVIPEHTTYPNALVGVETYTATTGTPTTHHGLMRAEHQVRIQHVFQQVSAILEADATVVTERAVLTRVRWGGRGWQCDKTPRRMGENRYSIKVDHSRPRV